jgi:taurine dioxygenase
MRMQPVAADSDWERGPEGLSMRRLEPFGVLVEGDLARAGTAAAQAWLVDLLDGHGIVAARGQSLDLARQRALFARLGRVPDERLFEIHPDDGALGRRALTFHSDLAFTHTPCRYVSLHGIEVDPGSVTRFANGVIAQARLSNEQRAQLALLEATAALFPECDAAAQYDIPPGCPCFTRPAIISHPRTGVPVLYVSEAQTARLGPLSRSASDSLLAELFALLYTPEAVLEWQWCAGDLLLWDNIALQHGRPEIAARARRRLQRAVVADLDLWDMLPEMFGGYA